MNYIKTSRLVARGVALALGLLLIDPVFAAAQDDPATVAAAPAEPQAKTLYWSGHEALASGNWSQAVERFRQLEIELRRTSAAGLDAALYWQAYAFDAGRRSRDASRLAARLEQEFPDSRWRHEAAKFRSDVAPVIAGAATARGTTEVGSGDPASEREADALMALDALMASGNAKAVPTLQRVLASDHADRVKMRALFVLSQIDESAAHAALDGILSGQNSVRLKREAIQQIAIGGNASSLNKLVALYPRVEVELRHAIVTAYMVAGRSDLLAQVARSESDPQVQVQAITLLGTQGESKAVRELLDTLEAPEAREAAIRALGLSGDAAALGELLRTHRDAATQQAALQALAISGAADATEVIVATYRSAADDEVRRAATQALLIAGDGASLLTLYRESRDREQKRALLQALTITDPDRALDAADEQL
jgi:HEAT repeat protein